MTSIRMEMKIAKANAAFIFSVNTAVCVRNPGPIADVAIRNAAPNSTLRISFLLLPPVASNRCPATPNTSRKG